MENFHARCVFFVRDAERSMAFYTKTLGFELDWNHEEEGKPFVFQVSLHGFQLILNQAVELDVERAGRGRVFIGLEDNQLELFRQHIKQHSIPTTVVRWGAPTVSIVDIDGNELFVWLPPKDREGLEADLAKREREAPLSDSSS